MSSPAPALSFVVPLYFTGDGVATLLDAFRDLTVDGGYEVILVNDGSTDETLSKLEALVPAMPYPVTWVDLARNYGEHAAVMEGLRRSRGEWVVTLDDDLQNPISEALRLHQHAITTRAEVVYSYYAKKKHSLFRNLGSWFTNLLASFFLGKPRDLYLCSFRCFSRSLVDRITLYSGPFPYIDGSVLNATHRIETLLVRHEERADGQSGYTLRRLVRLWMNMFFNFSIMPLRVASLFGLVLCLTGLGLAVATVLEYFYWKKPPTGWSSQMAAISLFSGGQLLILGLLGEYVGRAYLTLAGKPQSLVRSAHHHHP
ncbi:MAG: glycosyltransferase [Verrucomicrobiales bacterium]